MSALTHHVALVSDTPSVTLAQVSAAAAALQKQVTRDFGAAWGIQATVTAFDKLAEKAIHWLNTKAPS